MSIPFINEIITVISLLAAILAWVAKLKWSKEYSQAKDEIIRAKDAQIAMLKQQIDNLMDLNPVKLKEYYSTVKEQLEKYNDLLKEQLAAAKKEIEKMQDALNALRWKEEKDQEKIDKLTQEKDSLEENVQLLEGNLMDIQTELLTIPIEPLVSDLDPKRIKGIINTSNLIGNQLRGFSKKQEMNLLSESIKEKLDLIKYFNKYSTGLGKYEIEND
jgi:chromosome segregation ATPase